MLYVCSGVHSFKMILLCNGCTKGSLVCQHLLMLQGKMQLSEISKE